MALANITLHLPEMLYRRLVNTARATQQPIDQVIVHALELGSPPVWDDVPSEFQAELALMDRLDNRALAEIAGGRMSTSDDERYDSLLERNQRGELNDADRAEIDRLRTQADRFMLRKAHAAALLRWRGVPVPLPLPVP